jgi:hypothetical protein
MYKMEWISQISPFEVGNSNAMNDELQRKNALSNITV